jgi:hypothetical protein
MRRFLIILVSGAMAALVVASIPDIRRYLRISRM